MKYVVSTLLIILTLAGIIWGAIFPFTKARMYMEAFNVELASVGDFVNVFEAVIDFPSPVGDEEVTRLLSGVVERALLTDIPEEVASALVRYWESKAYKNNPRHLLAAASLYQNLWYRYKGEEYFEKAERYYLIVELFSPNLPQALYSLFEMYRGIEDEDKIREYGEKILSFWPQDERVRDFLEN